MGPQVAIVSVLGSELRVPGCRSLSVISMFQKQRSGVFFQDLESRQNLRWQRVAVAATVVGVQQMFWNAQPGPSRRHHSVLPVACLEPLRSIVPTSDQAIWRSRTGSMHLCHLAADRVQRYMEDGLPSQASDKGTMTVSV